MAKGGKTTKNTNAAADEAATKGVRAKKRKTVHHAIPLARLMPHARKQGNLKWSLSGKRALELISNSVMQSVINEAISCRDERKKIKINKRDLTNGARIAFARLKGVSDSSTFLNQLAN